MRLKLWQNISIIFCLIIGVILHFAYEWSGESTIVALFSSINESTWEHLKLAFFPMLFISILGYFIFGKKINNYVEANSIGIVCTMVFITVFFYTYTGIIGDNYAIINILIFVVAVILGEIVTCKILESNWKSDERLYLLVMLIFIICFFVFTVYPPKINYFKDPVTNAYGLQKFENQNE